MLTCLTLVTGDEAAGERAYLKAARATQQAGTGLARYLPGLPEKARDWQSVTERLKDGERLVRACYTAAVYAPLGAIDEAEQAVRAIYHGQGWRVAAERYVQLPAWLAGLPMVAAGGLAEDLERMGRMRTLLTASAVNLAPVHGEWRGQGLLKADNPPALLLIGRRGQPAGWSPFANDAGNYNVAVTGKSGSGKSVLMQELVAGIVGAGGEAVVIDDGRSFQHAAEALGGSFIAFGKDAARLNPFAMIDAETAARDGDYREECFRDARRRAVAHVPESRGHGRHRGGAGERSDRPGLGRGWQRGRSRAPSAATWRPEATGARRTWPPRSAPGARAERWAGCSRALSRRI